MPSKSRALFRDRLLPDVTNLIETHRQVNPKGQGRRRLGHITRSGVVMLCAAWELYVEQVLIEGASFLSGQVSLPSELPERVRGKLSQAAKNNPHKFGVLDLCGDGWKSVYLRALTREVEKLNTPKHGPVKMLFHDWLGWDAFGSSWRHTEKDLNDFVTLRGEIAHRGADARYIQVKELVGLKTLIDEIVVDTDRELSKFLKGANPRKRRPWNR